MIRILSLLLALSFIMLSLLSLTSCGGDKDPDDKPPASDGGDPDESDDGSYGTTIYVPEYKDYGRRTVAFSSITYSRPDVPEVSEAFLDVARSIEEDGLDFDTYLDRIEALTDGYESILTMSALSNIRRSQNVKSDFWNREYEYISKEYPSFAQSVEKLFVAAANSEYAERFEDEYFGDGLIEKYKDGGSYTDTLVKLMEDEAEIEARYNAISTATATITYKGVTDTFDKIIEYYEATYGVDSEEYVRAVQECYMLYEEESLKLSEEIYIALLKVRRLISDELGYSSYREYAYEAIYHDYTAEEMLKFASDIAEYIVPVYVRLASRVFDVHLGKETELPELDRVTLINTTHKLLGELDPELQNIYNYMLQNSLYDIDEANDSREDISFTTYLEGYDAPFIFMCSEGNASDYITLFHEFGHFADNYINFGGTAALDLDEVSSQALELLALTKLDGELDKETARYLTYYEMETTLLTLIYQGFYTVFEHKVYDLAYDAITKENVNRTVSQAANAMSLRGDVFTEMYYVLIPHTVLYPFYVQAYCTSLTVAMDIYFLECDTEGAGVDAYLKLIDRQGGDKTFAETAIAAGLSDPFGKRTLKKLADNIHYNVLGSYYFSDSSQNSNAA